MRWFGQKNVTYFHRTSEWASEGLEKILNHHGCWLIVLKLITYIGPIWISSSSKEVHESAIFGHCALPAWSIGRIHELLYTAIYHIFQKFCEKIRKTEIKATFFQTSQHELTTDWNRNFPKNSEKGCVSLQSNYGGSDTRPAVFMHSTLSLMHAEHIVSSLLQYRHLCFSMLRKFLILFEYMSKCGVFTNFLICFWSKT